MERRKSSFNPCPYARKDDDKRKSLISIVGDTIKDLLSPSWLTDLVNTVSQEPPTKPGAEDTSKEKFLSAKHTETEMEDECFPSTSRLPPHPTQGNGQPRTQDFSQRRPVPGPSMPAAPLMEFTSSQLPLARLADKSDSVLAQDESASQRSDTSTSGCSSMNPQPPSRTRQGPSTSSGLVSASPLNTSRQPAQKAHLWSTKANAGTPQRPANISKPAFNPLLYGSPLNSTAGGASTGHESSFYAGNVAFGGSSQRDWPKRQPKRRTTEPPDGTPHPPTRLKLDVKQNDRPVVTATTSRILDVLQSLDSSRPPQNIPSFIFPKSMAQTWKELNNRRTSVDRRSSLPTGSLNTSVQASISKNRLSSSGPYNKPPSQGPSKEDRLQFGTYNDTQSAGTGKARKEKSYQLSHYRTAAKLPNADQEEPSTEVPNLRTDFTLPVANIPNFNFTAAGQGTFGTASRQSPDFAFSSPLKEMSPAGKAASPGTAGGFQFSSPISVEQRDREASLAPPPREKSVEIDVATQTSATLLATVVPPTSGAAYNTAARPKTVINELPVRKSPSAAVKLKQGSVMDILGGGAKPASTDAPKPTGTVIPTTVAPKLSDIFKTTAGTWECTGCLLKVATTASKCPACGMAKPGATAPPATGGTAPVKNDLSSVFKVKAGTWECADCLCKNTADVAKCQVCQSPKPSPKPAPVKAIVPLENNNALSAKLSQPAGTWTCDTCLIPNKSDVDVCVACQAQRTPAGSASHSLLVETHGQLMPGNWICGKCWVQNRKDAALCAHCSTAKPDTPVTPPKFSADKQATTQSQSTKTSGVAFWTCDVCLVRNEGTNAMCVCCNTPKSAKPLRYPPGAWSCDRCGHSNSEGITHCSSCQYIRSAPPRTEAVPSCAKTYLEKRATVGATTNSTVSAALKIGAKSGTSNSSSSGFSFGDSSKKGDTSVTVGGFKFGGSAVTTAGATTIKFGSTVSSDNKKDTSTVPSYGFQIDKNATSENLSSGFKFGTSLPVTDKPASLGTGFVYGKPLAPVTSANTAVSASNPLTCNSTPVTASTGGFTFGQPQSKESDTLKATTSVPGGFNFKTTESSTLKTSEALNTQSSFTHPVTSQNIGAINSSLIFTKKAEASAIVTTQSLVSSAPSIGGFNYMNSTSSSNAHKESTPNITTVPTQNTTMLGAFNFAQQKPEVKVGGSEQEKTSPTKRGRTEDGGESAAKKPAFGFGTGPASTSAPSYQFGAANNSTATGTPMFSAFSQQPATASKTAPQPALPSGFNFGAAIKPVNTAQPTPQASNTAAFGFGAGVTPQLNFGGQKTETVSNSSTSSFPSNTGFAFGNMTAPAFGGTPAPTTAPAFGVAPTAAFCQSGSGTDAQAAGNSTFGGNSKSLLSVSISSSAESALLAKGSSCNSDLSSLDSSIALTSSCAVNVPEKSTSPAIPPTVDLDIASPPVASSSSTSTIASECSTSSDNESSRSDYADSESSDVDASDTDFSDEDVPHESRSDVDLPNRDTTNTNEPIVNTSDIDLTNVNPSDVTLSDMDIPEDDFSDIDILDLNSLKEQSCDSDSSCSGKCNSDTDSSSSDTDSSKASSNGTSSNEDTSSYSEKSLSASSNTDSSKSPSPSSSCEKILSPEVLSSEPMSQEICPAESITERLQAEGMINTSSVNPLSVSDIRMSAVSSSSESHCSNADANCLGRGTKLMPASDNVTAMLTCPVLSVSQESIDSLNGEALPQGYYSETLTTRSRSQAKCGFDLENVGSETLDGHKTSVDRTADVELSRADLPHSRRSTDESSDADSSDAESSNSNSGSSNDSDKSSSKSSDSCSSKCSSATSTGESNLSRDSLTGEPMPQGFFPVPAKTIPASQTGGRISTYSVNPQPVSDTGISAATRGAESSFNNADGNNLMAGKEIRIEDLSPSAVCSVSQESIDSLNGEALSQGFYSEISTIQSHSQAKPEYHELPESSNAETYKRFLSCGSSTESGVKISTVCLNPQVGRTGKVCVNPQLESGGRISTVRVNPQPESGGRISTIRVNPQPESGSRISTVRVNPQPELVGRISTVRVNPQPESGGRISTVRVNPQPESGSRISTVCVNPQPELGGRISTVCVNPQPESEGRSSPTRVNLHSDTWGRTGNACVSTLPDSDIVNSGKRPSLESTTRPADDSFGVISKSKTGCLRTGIRNNTHSLRNIPDVSKRYLPVSFLPEIYEVPSPIVVQDVTNSDSEISVASCSTTPESVNTDDDSDGEYFTATSSLTSIVGSDSRTSFHDLDDDEQEEPEPAESLKQCLVSDFPTCDATHDGIVNKPSKPVLVQSNKFFVEKREKSPDAAKPQNKPLGFVDLARDVTDETPDVTNKPKSDTIACNMQQPIMTPTLQPSFAPQQVITQKLQQPIAPQPIVTPKIEQPLTTQQISTANVQPTMAPKQIMSAELQQHLAPLQIITPVDELQMLQQQQIQNLLRQQMLMQQLTPEIICPTNQQPPEVLKPITIQQQQVALTHFQQLTIQQQVLHHENLLREFIGIRDSFQQYLMKQQYKLRETLLQQKEVIALDLHNNMVKFENIITQMRQKQYAFQSQILPHVQLVETDLQQQVRQVLQQQFGKQEDCIQMIIHEYQSNKNLLWQQHQHLAQHFRSLVGEEYRISTVAEQHSIFGRPMEPQNISEQHSIFDGGAMQAAAEQAAKEQVEQAAAQKAAAEQAAAHIAAKEQAAAQKAAEEQAAAQKAAEAAAQKAAEEQAAAQKAAEEQAAAQKAAEEQAAAQKAAEEQAAAEKAAEEQAAAQKAAEEQAAAQKAAEEQAAKEEVAKERAAAAERAAAHKAVAAERGAARRAAAQKISEDYAAKLQAAEQAVKEQAVKEQAAKEQAVKEQASKEQAVKEQVAKEQAVKELAANEQVAKEQAAAEAAAAQVLKLDQRHRDLAVEVQILPVGQIRETPPDTSNETVEPQTELCPQTKDSYTDDKYDQKQTDCELSDILDHAELLIPETAASTPVLTTPPTPGKPFKSCMKKKPRVERKVCGFKLDNASEPRQKCAAKTVKVNRASDYFASPFGGETVSSGDTVPVSRSKSRQRASPAHHKTKVQFSITNSKLYSEEKASKAASIFGGHKSFGRTAKKLPKDAPPPMVYPKEGRFGLCNSMTKQEIDVSTHSALREDLEADPPSPAGDVDEPVASNDKVEVKHDSIEPVCGASDTEPVASTGAAIPGSGVILLSEAGTGNVKETQENGKEPTPQPEINSDSSVDEGGKLTFDQRGYAIYAHGTPFQLEFEEGDLSAAVRDYFNLPPTAKCLRVCYQNEVSENMKKVFPRHTHQAYRSNPPNNVLGASQINGQLIASEEAETTSEQNVSQVILPASQQVAQKASSATTSPQMASQTSGQSISTEAPIETHLGLISSELATIPASRVPEQQKSQTSQVMGQRTSTIRAPRANRVESCMDVDDDLASAPTADVTSDPTTWRYLPVQTPAPMAANTPSPWQFTPIQPYGKQLFSSMDTTFSSTPAQRLPESTSNTNMDMSSAAPSLSTTVTRSEASNILANLFMLGNEEMELIAASRSSSGSSSSSSSRSSSPRSHRSRSSSSSNSDSSCSRSPSPSRSRSRTRSKSRSRSRSRSKSRSRSRSRSKSRSRSRSRSRSSSPSRSRSRAKSSSSSSDSSDSDDDRSRRRSRSRSPSKSPSITEMAEMSSDSVSSGYASSSQNPFGAPFLAKSKLSGGFQSGTAAAITPGVFQFGAKPPEPAPAPAPTQPPAAPQPAFNFGPLAASQNQTPGTYNFSTSAAPGSFAFRQNRQ